MSTSHKPESRGKKSATSHSSAQASKAKGGASAETKATTTPRHRRATDAVPDRREEAARLAREHGVDDRAIEQALERPLSHVDETRSTLSWIEMIQAYARLLSRPEPSAQVPEAPPAQAEDPHISPDLTALGMEPEHGPLEGRSLVGLLLYAYDYDAAADPAAAVLSEAGRLIECVAAASLETPVDSSVLFAITRQIEAGIELHRRQRAALLDALKTAHGAAQ